MLRTMQYLQAGKWWAIGLLWVATAGQLPGGELLPNGIELPEVWAAPPWSLDRRADAGAVSGEAARRGADRRRAAIVRRRFPIERTTLVRTYHRPKYHEASPVLKPETSWEHGDDGDWAAPFSDGAWFSIRRRNDSCYGIAPPIAALVPGAVGKTASVGRDRNSTSSPATNIVLASQNKTSQRDSNTECGSMPPQSILRNASSCSKPVRSRTVLHGAANLTRRRALVGRKGRERAIVDRSTAFYNPFRKVLVASVRGHDNVKPERRTGYGIISKAKTAAEAVSWKQETDAVSRGELLPNDLVPWVGADSLDPRHPDPSISTEKPQCTTSTCFPTRVCSSACLPFGKGRRTR